MTRDNRYAAADCEGEFLIWRLSDGQKIFQKQLAKNGGFVSTYCAERRLNPFCG